MRKTQTYCSGQLIASGGLLALAVMLSGCARTGYVNSAHPPLSLARTSILPGVTKTRANVGVPGRIDHMAYDAATDRLFVAALENSSVEVLDLKSGRRLQSIPGILHAQGAACVSNACIVAVTSGQDGLLHIFDTRTLEEKRTVEIGPDADNVRYDARNNTILVTYGTTNAGSIAVLDAGTWERLRTLQFSSRPESFQLDPNGKWLFANLPRGVRAVTDGEVAVVDRETSQTEAIIPLPGRARNFPMAYDAAHGRLFIACRRPARLIEIDVHTRAIVVDVPCTDDSDDLFYDAETSQVLVIGGGFRPDLQTPESVSPRSPPGEMGGIDVFGVAADGALTRKVTIPTYFHVRTGLFVPMRRALYLAVPLHDKRPPEIREYILE